MRAMMLSLLFAATIAAAGTPEQDRALREIEAFTTAQQKSDPLYPAVEAELMKGIDDMLKSRPATEWAPTIKRWYFTESERAHAQERAAAREQESAAIAAGPRDQLGAWMARMAALDGAMDAGKLTPREHAVRMLEAARIVYPGDSLLIGLRETKLALATDYELGNITRAQFDERWARARTAFDQSATAREQAVLATMRAEEAAMPMGAGPSLGDRFRQQRGITCKTTPGPFGSTINCR